jgi:hypothetical protein
LLWWFLAAMAKYEADGVYIKIDAGSGSGARVVRLFEVWKIRF